MPPRAISSPIAYARSSTGRRAAWSPPRPSPRRVAPFASVSSEEPSSVSPTAFTGSASVEPRSWPAHPRRRASRHGRPRGPGRSSASSVSGDKVAQARIAWDVTPRETTPHGSSSCSSGRHAGLVFAGVSTYDFVQHLDRQVHSLHCSFIPGGARERATGLSGRDDEPVLVGVPHAACGAAFRSRCPRWRCSRSSLFYAIDLLLTRRKDDPRATAFLALATCAAGADVDHDADDLAHEARHDVQAVRRHLHGERAVPDRRDHAVAPRGRPRARVGDASKNGAQRSSTGRGARAASNGSSRRCSASASRSSRARRCSTSRWRPITASSSARAARSRKPDDTYGVMVHGRSAPRATPRPHRDPRSAVPRVQGVRAAARGVGLRRPARSQGDPVPARQHCNWMITETTHPGACTVSEAVLCAGDKRARGDRVGVRGPGPRSARRPKADPAAAARIVKQRFPELASVRRLAGGEVAAQQVAALGGREQHPRADAAAVRRQRQAVRRGRRPRPRLRAAQMLDGTTAAAHGQAGRGGTADDADLR